jgi:hypothetical protein
MASEYAGVNGLFDELKPAKPTTGLREFAAQMSRWLVSTSSVPMLPLEL